MVDRLANSEANARRISYVEQCFGSAGQPLQSTGRALVGEGVLIKMCRKKPKPRQFFLFNDILVYGNVVINKKKYNQQHIFPLEDVRLQSAEDFAELRNGWHIISPIKSFTVYAATAMEKADWIMHINRCVQELRLKKGLPAVAEQDLSPVWVPDDGAPVCMHCRKTQFTVLNRRHHCRKCGIVCCNACSNKRWVLQHQSPKPVRVCLSCFNKLTIHALQMPPAAQPHEQGASGVNSESSEEESSDFDQPTLPQQPTFYANIEV